VVTGGSAAVIAVVGLVLAVAGVIGAWLPLLAGVVAVVCAVMFRRTVGR
jgi:uncharacterized membrane protein YbaN (DUF454 family)